MKKIFVLILSVILVITGCKKEEESKPREKYKGDTAENITMKIKEGTLTNSSATIIIEDLSDKDNIYGDEYVLCEKIDNEWFYIPTKVEPVVWETIGYLVDKNNLLEMKMYWDWLYGELKPGEYKLIKGASPEGELNNYTFSVDFTIEPKSIHKEIMEVAFKKIVKYEEDTVENVTMKVKDGTLTNSSAIVIIECLNDKVSIFNEEFSLCKKIGDECIYLYSNFNELVFNAYGYSDYENNRLETEVNWERFYGKLDPGEYKLVKRAAPLDENNHHTFSADFTIK